jgi:hypothetical protein
MAGAYPRRPQSAGAIRAGDRVRHGVFSVAYPSGATTPDGHVHSASGTCCIAQRPRTLTVEHEPGGSGRRTKGGKPYGGCSCVGLKHPMLITILSAHLRFSVTTDRRSTLVKFPMCKLEHRRNSCWPESALDASSFHLSGFGADLLAANRLTNEGSNCVSVRLSDFPLRPINSRCCLPFEHRQQEHAPPSVG